MPVECRGGTCFFIFPLSQQQSTPNVLDMRQYSTRLYFQVYCNVFHDRDNSAQLSLLSRLKTANIGLQAKHATDRQPCCTRAVVLKLFQPRSTLLESHLWRTTQVPWFNEKRPLLEANKKQQQAPNCTMFSYRLHDLTMNCQLLYNTL